MDKSSEEERSQVAGEDSSSINEKTGGDASDTDAYERLEVLAEMPVDRATLQLPLGATPRTWRQLLHFAVGQLYPNGEYSDAEYLTRFETLHGPCAMSDLLGLASGYAALRDNPQALADGADLGGDILFVLYMLGVWPEHPLANQARETLGWFLSSPLRGERWVSAIGLSHLRDERAIPMLITMLREDLPEPEPWDVQSEEEARTRWERFEHAAFYADLLLRKHVPHILWRWGVRSAVPALRQTLILMARIERTSARWDPWKRWGHAWWDYQRELVDSLARFDAFGALIEIEPPLVDDTTAPSGEPQPPRSQGAAPSTSSKDSNRRRYQWRVEMCAEVASQRFEEAGRRGTVKGEEVRPEVERLLAELFGLDEDERHAALEPYYDFQFRLELY